LAQTTHDLTLFHRTFDVWRTIRQFPNDFRTIHSRFIEDSQMRNPTYRVTLAAQLLNTTPYTLRQLAKAGLIEAESTPRGHLRFPVPEIERLQREGLPPLPVEAPEARDAMPARPAPRRSEDDAQFGEGRHEVESERAALAVAQTRTERRRAELESERVKDEFEALERARQDARQNEARRAESAKEAAERRDWENGLILAVLSNLPNHLPQSARGAVIEAARAQIAKLSLKEDPRVVAEFVWAGVAPIVEGHERSRRMEAAVKDAVLALPSEARDWLNPTPYEIEAKRLAREALQQAPDADNVEMSAIARHAVEPIRRRFEHDEKKKALIDGLWLWRYGVATTSERNRATQAAKEALDAAPATADPDELERIVSMALEPHERAPNERRKWA
jgi:hypothetical protein